MDSQLCSPGEIDDLRRQLASLQQEKAALLQQIEQYKARLVQQQEEGQVIEGVLRKQRDISLLLSSTSDLIEVLRGLLSVIFQIEGIDAGGVYLVDEATGDLSLVIHAGLPDDFVAATSCFPADSPQAILVKQGQSIYSHHEQVAPVMDDIRQQVRLRALAVLPIRYEEEVVAVFNLASRTQDEFNREMRETIEALIAPMGGVVARVRAEAALRASQQDLENLYQTLEDFIFVVDSNGRIWHMNPAASRGLDYTIEELRGQPITRLHPTDQEEAVMTIFRAMVAGESAVCSIPLLSKQGQIIPVETKVFRGKWRGEPVIIGISRDMTVHEQMRQMLQTAHDRLETQVQERTASLELANTRLKAEILERQRAEAALKESQARLSAFFNQSLDGCFFMMLDEPIRWNGAADKEALLDYAFTHQRVTAVNDAMLAQYGMARLELIGATPEDMFAHDPAYGRAVWREFWDNGRIRLETDERKADGTPMWIEGEYVCLYDEYGRITGHFGIQREITDRKQAVAALDESQKMLRLVLDNVPQAVFWKDRQSVYLGCNRAFAEDAGFAVPEALIGLTDFDMPWAKDQAGFYRAIDREVMENDQPLFNIEEPQTQADGRQIWLMTNKIPLHDNAGNVVGILGTYEDVTELKKAEEAVRRGEEIYRRIVDTAEEGIWLLDEDGRTRFVNNKMAEMLQYNPDEMIGRHLFDFMDEAVRASAAENLQRRQQGIREQHDFQFKRKDGADLWVIISTSPITDDDGRYSGALGMVTDITDRRQVQISLEKYARRLETLRDVDRAILKTRSPMAIADTVLLRVRELLPIVRASVLLIDRQTNTGKIISGFSDLDTQVEVGMSRPVAEFGLHQELFKGNLIIRNSLNEMMDSDSGPVVEMIQKEGIRSLIGAPLIFRSELIGVLYLASESPHVFTDEHIEIARELAHSLAVVLQQARLMEEIQNHASELEQRVAQRTQALAEANERLKELDRLKSKFVSDITHELRTPVTNMILYLDLMRFGKPENHEHYQRVLRQQTERLRQLVEDSMDLSRLDLTQEDVQLLPLDINSIAAQALAVFKKKAEDKGLLLIFAPAELPAVLMDGGQMSRVMGNLLKNAIDFTPAGQVCLLTLLNDTAEFVGIRVQDTGIGFTEEEQNLCFVPFYRGERVGQLNVPGNGLGLSLVKRIVDLHNGRIEIESVIDQGSTVTVWLPLNRPDV